jgi:hypothetical protein
MKNGTWMVAALGALVVTGSVLAQEEKPGAAPSAEELGKQLSNPIADLVSIPLQLNWEEGVGPDNDLRFIMNFQPVVPFHITPNWNLIGRMIVPYVTQPALTPGGPTASGTGDIVASAFFSPVHAKNGLTWGVGPVFNLPTTTNPLLGSGQWGIGPTFVILKQQGPWTYGGLVNQIWGIADTGNVPRTDLNQMFIQPFCAFTTPHAVTYTIQSETTANWEASGGDRWNIPINVLVSKVTKLGPFPFSIGGGAGYFVDSPDGTGANWKLRAFFTLILPSKK